MAKSNLKTTIDALGALKAQIAELEIQEKALKASLGELEPGAYEGELYRVTVAKTDRETLDMEAVRAKLSPQFISAHTRVTPVTTIRVGVRTGKGVAA